MKLAILLLAAALAAHAQFVRRAPGFSLPDSSAKQHDLADYRGKVVLLDIMQTTCPKCIELGKMLEQVKPKYGDKIQVLSIVVASQDNTGTVSKYKAANKVTDPVLFDCGQVIASYLNITPSNPTIHFPHLIVIDKNGFIRRDLSETGISLTNLLGSIEGALK